MKHKKIIAYLRKRFQLSRYWKLYFDDCGMLHIHDPSGASAAWLGDGRQF